MPVDGQTALIVIAAAVSVQAVLLVGAVVAGVIAWRRFQMSFERRSTAIVARVDEAVGHAQHAALAVERLSDRASTMVGEAHHAVRSVAGIVANRRTLLAAGVASAAGRWLARRRQRRANRSRPFS